MPRSPCQASDVQPAAPTRRRPLQQHHASTSTKTLHEQDPTDASLAGLQKQGRIKQCASIRRLSAPPAAPQGEPAFPRRRALQRRRRPQPRARDRRRPARSRHYLRARVERRPPLLGALQEEALLGEHRVLRQRDPGEGRAECLLPRLELARPRPRLRLRLAAARSRPRARWVGQLLEAGATFGRVAEGRAHRLAGRRAWSSRAGVERRRAAR
eukprot:5902218-Prymnesium_polylepis.1